MTITGRIEVRTTDGRTRRGNHATLGRDRLILGVDAHEEDIPSGEVKRIKVRPESFRFVRHSGRALLLGALLLFVPCDRWSNGAAGGIPVVAYAAASAPITLMMDGVVALVPARVFDLVP